ncbi:homocysteine S-methyltransferase family protein [Alkaliphilus crotonatoxidans]
MRNLINEQNKMILFDGAMGTMLQRAGLEVGALPELLNLEKPELIREIHQSYVKAGAQIITTNTFQANELKLGKSSHSLEAIIEAGVRLAREAKAPYVAQDIGPLGQMLAPLGEISFQRAYEIFKRQVMAGVKAGVDCIIIETLSDLYEAKAALLAVKENSDLPVFCTMTFQGDGRTFVGTDAITATQVLQGLGADALGINCSLGPKEILPLLPDVLKYAKVPVIVQPNAGLPTLVQGKTVFPVEPAAFGEYGRQLAKLGVKILGGCCGTTPDHIRALQQQIDRFQFQPCETKIVTCCTSGTKTVILDGKTTITGERINPTGKKQLKEALRQNDLEVLLTEAIEQTRAGAHILDVNVGLPEINEERVLKEAVTTIQTVVDTPLQIDSVNIKALEGALRCYNGKPIINSVNGKESSMEQVFPLAKKYGAVLVALTLDEGGIPETAEGRVAIAEKIMKGAMAYGIPKEDLIIDCLVMTVSAQQSIVMETLKAVSLVKERLGLKTTLGVSNVSFGLPNRSLINRTFLAGALMAGLDVPILDPLSEEMMNTVKAHRVLKGEDQEAKDFIRDFQGIQPGQGVMPHENNDLKAMIVEGRKGAVADTVRLLLKEMDGLAIINQFFIPALDQVGEAYEGGILFLPQLLRAAEAVKAGLEVIKGASSKNTSVLQNEKIILATVQGDIHDIGKNIAKMLLENYGYNILDLGKDVAPEVILAAVKEHGVRLVGLSALMTTTVKNMQRTIELIKGEVPECKIMVGGAVLNPRYAEMIGADYYAVDGQAGIRFARRLLTEGKE